MKLPLALSTAGHAAILAVLILYAIRIGPPPTPALTGAVAVVFSRPGAAAAATPQPIAAAAKPAPAKPAAKPAPIKPAAKPAPAEPAKPPAKPRPVENRPPPVPQPVVQVAPVPRPPHKPIFRQPERRVVRRLRRPIVRPSEERFERRLYQRVTRQPPPYPAAEPTAEPVPAPLSATAGSSRYPAARQTAAAAAASAPAYVPGPDAAQRYVAMVRAWLERHKRYPDTARQRGEEGSVAVRFRVDRSGSVLGYSLQAGTGYADLDAGVRDMMQGARLPPFPPGLMESEVDLTVTIRFSLTR